MEVDIGHIYTFPFQWESCTNHINGIFTLKIGYSRICACASFVYVFCFDQL